MKNKGGESRVRNRHILVLKLSLKVTRAQKCGSRFESEKERKLKNVSVLVGEHSVTVWLVVTLFSTPERKQNGHQNRL